MKPVAYITKYDLERLPLYDCWVNGEKSKGSIPLYTHPVKELTDEEIMECERWVFLQERMRATNDSWNFTIELARAILRKAQEK
jgi:hypothetical protein